MNVITTLKVGDKIKDPHIAGAVVWTVTTLNQKASGFAELDSNGIYSFDTISNLKRDFVLVEEGS